MVGYDSSYQANSDMDVAIVQCGYGDGIPFEYSNKGFVYYNKSKTTIPKIFMNNKSEKIKIINKK
mgnify:CR=1 FL=1